MEEEKKEGTRGSGLGARRGRSETIPWRGRMAAEMDDGVNSALRVLAGKNSQQT